MMICEFSDFSACVVTTTCEPSHGSNSTHKIIEQSFDDKKSLNSFSQVNWNVNGFNAVCHSVTWNVHLAMMIYKCTIKVEAVKH